MSVSSHVLDTASGKPAAGMEITLEQKSADGWQHVSRHVTDSDGRVKNLAGSEIVAGVYRLTFATGAYLEGEGFYPEVTVAFEIRDASQHYHVPLLLSPYGYSTYRGS